MMVAVLRHQKALLDELVNVFEQMEVGSAEDYSYCGNRTSEIIRNLKSVRRFAFGEMAKGFPQREKVASR